MYGGFAGATDDDLLSIPYANLLQALRLASENEVRATRDEWKRAAFVGWQVRSAVAGMFGGQTGQPFGRYLDALGLSREPIKVENTLDKARENAERVRRAFAERGVRRSE